MVHATHLTARDLELLGGSRAFACLCPTTEADLADGIGPAGALTAAGSALTVGSDSQAVIDLFEQARRVSSTSAWPPASGATSPPTRWPGRPPWTGTPAWAGRTRERSPRARSPIWSPSRWTHPGWPTPAASALESVIFAATAADVRAVVIGGRDVVRAGTHLLVPDVPAALAAAIRAVTS